MLTKEEAHWLSFRSAVFGIQSSLAEQVQPQANDSLANRGDEGPDHMNNNTQQNTEGITASADASRHDEVIREPQSATLNDSTNNNEPTSQSNEKGKTSAGGDNEAIYNSWEDASNMQKEQCQHLELIGLEEVNKSANSRNNTLNALVSPANAPSHTSHTTNALSIAEQQLAETRLKLAMTESERDELEFQLMQNTS